MSEIKSPAEQAELFLESCGAKVIVKYDKFDFFYDDDKEPRDIYAVRITRGDKRYSVKIASDTPPTAYDILTGLEMYEPATDVWHYAKLHGIKINDRQSYEMATKMCKLDCREWRYVNRLFGDVLEQLRCLKIDN